MQTLLARFNVWSVQDFQLQQLQHKLNWMEGERTDDEKLQLNARIKVRERLNKPCFQNG